MLEQIQLTPFDPNKSLRLVIDGASIKGAGFVLFQYVDEINPGDGTVIVNANCKEAEGIALDFAICCCSYWISYCLQVELYSCWNSSGKPYGMWKINAFRES